MRRLALISSLFVTLVSGLLLGAISSGGFAQGQVFDHTKKGFELLGGHSVLSCESCHIGGQFEGTPKNCVGCHSLNGKYNATPKPINHISVSEQCDACHRPTLWEDMPRVDHDHVFGSCESCHNNVIVPGKPVDHLPVHNDCSACHSNLSFVPAVMNHDNLIVTCYTCHNNVDVRGKPATHPPTTNNCDGCHSTQTFLPVAWFDHGEATGECVDCHRPGGPGGADAKPGDHITISQDLCQGCHVSQQSWEGYFMEHNLVSDDCLGCHYKGSPYTGQYDGHVETGTTQCSVCHTSRTSFAF